MHGLRNPIVRERLVSEYGIVRHLQDIVQVARMYRDEDKINKKVEKNDQKIKKDQRRIKRRSLINPSHKLVQVVKKNSLFEDSRDT